MSQTANVQGDIIVDALGVILAPGQVTELRALDAFLPGSNRPAIYSGYFNDPAKLAEAAKRIRSAKGIYFIPNPINPAMLARSMNKARTVYKEPLTADHDIAARHWLLVDCDAVRPAGIAANDEEHAAAIERARAIADELTALGWPLPIVADSGNGGHLLYRIDLPVDDEKLVERCLAVLGTRFTDSVVLVDKSVHNPARIWKLYGTLACKGDAEAASIGRPHRMSKILDVPAEMLVVTRQQLEELGGKAEAPQASIVPIGSFDLAEWIQRHGLNATGPEPWQGSGRRWIFKTCPWNADHTDRSAFVAQLPNGAIAAGCHHNGCQGRTWHDLRKLFERPELQAEPDISALSFTSADSQAELTQRVGPVPAKLMHVPGFVDEVMRYTLATAPYPNTYLAFTGALALQAFLAARRVRDAADNRTTVYFVALARPGVGKDHPRKINDRILQAVGLDECIGNQIASGESIEDSLYTRPAMLFQTDEVDALLQAVKTGRDTTKNGIIAVLLTMYTTTNSVYRMRIRAGQEAKHIDQPALIWYATATEEHGYSSLSEKMLTDGFVARLVIGEAGPRGRGQESVITDPPESIIKVAEYWRDFQPGTGNLSAWHPVPIVVDTTHEAKLIFKAHREQVDSEYDSAINANDNKAAAILARTHEKARRLALIYACSVDHTQPIIDTAAATWAIEFADHLTKHMLYVAENEVAGTEFEGMCQRMRGILQGWRDSIGDAWMPGWKVNRKLRGWTPRQIKEVRESLVSKGELEWTVNSTGGRTGEVYRLS